VLDKSTMRSNVQFYSRLGFKTTADSQPGDGAPRVWVMTRTPQTIEALSVQHTPMSAPDRTVRSGRTER